MRFFITTHTIQGKNNLQKAIIAEVEKWEGTLIEKGGAQILCIDNFKKTLNHFNRELPKCKPCQMSLNDNSISFATYMTDDTFAILTFHEVKNVYNGFTLSFEGKERR